VSAEKCSAFRATPEAADCHLLRHGHRACRTASNGTVKAIRYHGSRLHCVYIYLIYMISLPLGQDEKQELGPLHMKPVMGLEIVLNV